MLVDFSGGDLDALLANQPVQAVLNARNGDVDNVTVQRLAENGMWRVSFRVQPKNNQAVDLHCYLTLYGEALTESWMYLWTP
jgi:glucans biosynthesis protein